MPQINLLPWREELREKHNKQFVKEMIGTLIVATGIAFLVLTLVNSLADEQNNRNALLTKEIAVLDQQIKEISTLEEEREKLLARIQIIQKLQESRPKVVKVLDAIARTVPDGVYLEKVTRKGRSITFDGVAQSNARVSVFMRQLDENQEFEDGATINVVKRTSTNDNAISKFTLSVKESGSKVGDGES